MIPRDFRHIQKAFSVIDVLAGIETKTELQDAVGDLSRDFGFESFVVTRLPCREQRVRQHVLLHSGWRDWLYTYDRSRYYLHDPVVHRCFQTVEPFLWHETIRGDLPAPSVKMMEDAASWGMNSGLAVPVIDQNGLHSVVSFAGGPSELEGYEKRALQLFAYYAHGAAERLTNGSEARGTLSERELEVLTLIAQGYTLSRIATILSISPETAKTHIKRARAKLGTANATHTVVAAIRSRQLKV